MDKELKIAMMLLVVVMLAVVTFVLVSAHCKAETFNKFKKPDIQEATMWDALFVNFTVVP